MARSNRRRRDRAFMPPVQLDVMSRLLLEHDKAKAADERARELMGPGYARAMFMALPRPGPSSTGKDAAPYTSLQTPGGWHDEDEHSKAAMAKVRGLAHMRDWIHQPTPDGVWESCLEESSRQLQAARMRVDRWREDDDK